MSRKAGFLAALGLSTALTAGIAHASDPAACQTVRFSDVGWTDITATTATTSVVLEGLGYQPQTQVLSVPVTYTSLASGDIAGIQIEPITATVPLEFLSANTPNLLTIQREDGLGRLYYNLALNVNRPVQDVRPLDNGMRVDRVFCNAASRTRGCAPLFSVQLASAQSVTAQLTLVLPHDSYYVMVEDFIPAGMEILNRSLKTSQQGIEATDVEAEVQFDDSDPFAEGWGWWLFNEPQIRDDSILFSANFLPAGTYVLTYTLIPLQAGEYRVLPAHAWQAFFPEVQGTSAGAVFEIKP